MPSTDTSAEISDELVTELPAETPIADASAAAPASLEATVEAWFARHFHGLGPRLSEELFNVAHAAKADLLAILRAA